MNALRLTTFAGLLTCAAGLSVNAQAQEQKKSEDCWQTAMTQFELNQCAGEHRNKARDKLEQTYEAILEEYAEDPVFVAAFKTSQEAWVAYKEAQMKMKYPHADEPGFHPSVLPMCQAMYATSLVKARTAQLKQWLKGRPLDKIDVCAGSIKYSPTGSYGPEPSLEMPPPSITPECREDSRDYWEDE